MVGFEDHGGIVDGCVRVVKMFGLGCHGSGQLVDSQSYL